MDTTRQRADAGLAATAAYGVGTLDTQTPPAALGPSVRTRARDPERKKPKPPVTRAVERSNALVTVTPTIVPLPFFPGTALCKAACLAACNHMHTARGPQLERRETRGERTRLRTKKNYGAH